MWHVGPTCRQTWNADYTQHTDCHRIVTHLSLTRLLSRRVLWTSTNKNRQSKCHGGRIKKLSAAEWNLFWNDSALSRRLWKRKTTVLRATRQTAEFHDSETLDFVLL